MSAALPPVFAGLSPHDTREATDALRWIDVAPGEAIFLEGEMDTTLAFLVTGAAEVRRGPMRISTAGPRDLLGEIEVFARLPRQTTAVATSAVGLYALTPEALAFLCGVGNPVVFAIERAVHRRLADRTRLAQSTIGEHLEGSAASLRPPQPSWWQHWLKAPPDRLPPAIDRHVALASARSYSWIEPALLQLMAAGADVVQFGPEETMLAQGIEADRIFVLVSGRAECWLWKDGGRAITLASYEAGEAFGDASIVAAGPSTVSVVSRTEVVAVTFDRRTFLHYFESNDPVGSAFRQASIRSLVLQHLGLTDQLAAALTRSRTASPAFAATPPPGGLWRD